VDFEGERVIKIWDEMEEKIRKIKRELRDSISVVDIISKNCEEKVEIFGAKVNQIWEYLNKIDYT